MCCCVYFFMANRNSWEKDLPDFQPFPHRLWTRSHDKWGQKALSFQTCAAKRDLSGNAATPPNTSRLQGCWQIWVRLTWMSQEVHKRLVNVGYNPTYKWGILGLYNPLILTIDPNFRRDNPWLPAQIQPGFPTQLLDVSCFETCLL